MQSIAHHPEQKSGINLEIHSPRLCGGRGQQNMRKNREAEEECESGEMGRQAGEWKRGRTRDGTSEKASETERGTDRERSGYACYV